MGATAIVAMALFSGGCALEGSDDPRDGAPASAPRGGQAKFVDPAAAEALRAAGRNASLEVLPTMVAGRPMVPVGEVVALMLERGGMMRLAVGENAFAAPADADLVATAMALGDFVKAHPGASDFVLFTDFSGAPATGFTSVTAIVVDRQGRVAWAERAAKGDRAFDRTRIREPMDGCVFVASELRPVLSLGDPKSRSASGGPIAERMQRSAGVPDKAELDAIEARLKDLCARAATATLLVVPTRIDGAFSRESAASIAARCVDAKWTRATAAESGPQPARSATMNQQKVAWSLAHELSTWVKERRPDADFVLMADYLIGEKGVLGVQWAICDREGRIVMVEIQNDHQKAFKAIDPRDSAQCDELVVHQTVARCRE